MDAAIKLIGEHGIERATFEEIAAAAGFSRGLPRHYFGSKENLVVRINEDISASFLAALRTPAYEAAGGLDRVILYVETYLSRAQASHTNIARVLQLMRASSLIGNETLRAAVANANNPMLEGIAVAIHRGQDAGEIRPDADPQAYSIFVTGALRGMVGLYLADPKNVDLAAASREFTRALRADLSS